MELRNFRRGRHLYSAGRASHWASAHILVDSVIGVFLENSENDSKLKDWINFGIYWKNLLSHSRPWPWVCGLALALHVSGLGLGHGLGLDTSGLVNIPAGTRRSVQTASDVLSKRICSLDTSASSALGIL